MVKDGADAGGRRQPGEAGYGPRGATNLILPCQTPLSSCLIATKKPAGRRQKRASATPPKGSTPEPQTTENQRGEIEEAGFTIQPRRLTEEQISGSVAAVVRPGFARLIDRMENGDVLIVTKLDRLGRDVMDVRKTVEQQALSGIRVHCLALGGVDLTSATGKMTMQVISAVAEFEKDLLIDRTHSGLVRARAACKRFGRPPALSQVRRLAALVMWPLLTLFMYVFIFL